MQFQNWLRGRGFDPETLRDDQIAPLQMAFDRSDAAPLEFAGTVELQAAGASGDRPRLTIRAYSGGIMSPSGMFPLVIDLATLVIPKSLPILADHSASIEGTIGQGVPRVAGGVLNVDATLASTELAGQVEVLLRDGVRLQASVGASRGQSDFIAAGNTVKVNGREHVAGPNGLTVIRKSELKEVSITPIGADSSTSVSIAASFAAYIKKGLHMKGILRNHDAGDNAGGATFERQQAALIAGYECESLPASTLAAIRAAAIERGDTFERFEHAAKAAALDHIRASRPTPSIAAPQRRSGGDVNAGDIVAAALLRRVAPHIDLSKAYGDQTANRAGDIRARHCVDVLKAAWTMRGERAPDTIEDMVKASGFSTNSIGNIIGNVANKIAVAAFASYDQSWRAIAQVVNLSNFKDHSRIRLNFSNGSMEVVGSGGEIPMGALSDSADTIAAQTYGKRAGLTRQQIIDDDLGILATIPTEIAKSAARTISNVAYTKWLAGVAGNHWTTLRGNYIDGSTTVLGYASLATVLRMLRTITDENGYPIAIPPKVLLVPPQLETTAREILFSQTITRSGGDALPEGSAMQGLNITPVVEPRLSNTLFAGNSAVAWYLCGGPADGPLVVGFLDGKETPTIETADADFSTLGIQMRGYIDFGAALGEYRASIRSKGAA